MEDPRPRAPEHGQPRRALGRGLGALIPGAGLVPETGVTEIPVDRIRPNSLQPRAGFDREPLAELEASIREHGVLQPVLLRPSGDRYELVAGERRWRAAVAAGLSSVPAVVRQMDDRNALEVALVENLQREDLNPMERARAYRRLIDEFGLTQEQVARRVGRSQPTIANAVRLLSLPAEVQASLEAGRITEGHARALLAIPDPERLLLVWRKVEARGMSVRETEAEAARRLISREIGAKRKARDPELSVIEQTLRESLGAPVSLRVKRGGGGEIRIAFFSTDDLERLVEALALRPGAGGGAR